jgi:hypothetical protein
MSFFSFFFPLIFEIDGSLTTNNEEIIIVFVQNLILSKNISFYFFVGFFLWEINSCFLMKDFVFFYVFNN